MSEKKEYIERGALIAFVRGVRQRLPKDSKDFFTRDEMLLNFQQYIECQKAEDVEPVVRGEWIEMRDPYGDLTGWIHEECGHETQCASNYCSKFGAKMKFIERSGSGDK